MNSAQFSTLAVVRLAALKTLEYTAPATSGTNSTTTYPLTDVPDLLIKHASESAETSLFNYRNARCIDEPSLQAFSISGKDLLPVTAPSFWFLHPKLCLAAYLSELYMRIVPSTRFREPSTLVVTDAIVRALASLGSSGPSFRIDVNPAARDLSLTIKTAQREKCTRAFLQTAQATPAGNSLIKSLASDPRGPLLGAPDWAANALAASAYVRLLIQDTPAAILAYLDSSAAEVATPFATWQEAKPLQRGPSETDASWTARLSTHSTNMAALREACTTNPVEKDAQAPSTSCSLTATSATLAGPVLIDMQGLARSAMQFVTAHDRLTEELEDQATRELARSLYASELDVVNFIPNATQRAALRSSAEREARELMLQRSPDLPDWLEPSRLTYLGFPPVELFHYLGSIVGHWSQRADGNVAIPDLLKKYVDDEAMAISNQTARTQFSTTLKMQVQLLGVATTTISPRAQLRELMLKAYTIRKDGRFTPMPSFYQTTSSIPSIEQSSRATHLALMTTQDDPAPLSLESDLRPKFETELKTLGVTPATVSLNTSINWITSPSKLALDDFCNTDSDLQLLNTLMNWASLERVSSATEFIQTKKLLLKYIQFWNRRPAEVDTDLAASAAVAYLHNDGILTPSSSSEFRKFFSRVYRSNEHRVLRLSYDFWNDTDDFYTAQKKSEYTIVAALAEYNQDLSADPQLTQLLLDITLARLAPPPAPFTLHVGEYVETQPTPAGVAALSTLTPKYHNYII
jgi:hypothetical protein